LCNRSKSSCTMMWSEMIRGAQVRFGFDALTFQFRCLCSLGCRATQIQIVRFRPQLAISGVYSRKRVRCRSVPALAALHANIGTTRSIFERCAAFVRERAHYSILNRWYGFIVGIGDANNRLQAGSTRIGLTICPELIWLRLIAS
jgi:hypothetical protein